jgi:hypothetical protein
MSDKQLFIMAHDEARRRAMRAVADAPAGWRVGIEPPKRNGEQNAKFHAMCADLAKSDFKWAGRSRNAAEWKVLLVSGHSKATNEAFDIVPGLEGEFVNLRESTALMSVKRSSSLIEYALAFLAMQGVEA